MVLLCDEVGENIEMTGDGHIGGEKVFCDKVIYYTKKSNKKVKHFTVIGLTNLLGEPISCIVIIEGRESLFDIRAGNDFSKDKVGYERMEKNNFARM